MAVANKDISLTDLITEGKNPRGIPASTFIEDVELFLGDVSVESALGAFNELYSKYKYMESSFERSKNVYKSKIPEIEQTLELIKLMIHKKEEDEEMITNYNLCDTIYAAARVDIASEKVYLWVGASTMVEYGYAEALALLENQLVQSHAKIEELQEDLYHLRGNSITVEVNMARLFNHSVKLKKAREAAQAQISEPAAIKA
ncbi:Prefoldin subunit-domain-containing protein [Ochromonadaceae sp. CCMP2298]|nr:Prefoldin subunit-domain-containing protein [Ochromonadaceae sp. CCMP2298]|mmetsp:Transcript_23298/g.51720  ORF Transcript_23298/g.51720 Transcript_23298/m.51720 type:complete len:202 (-) Transcript_23298:281-886(-)